MSAPVISNLSPAAPQFCWSSPVLGFAADRGGLCPATDRLPDEYDVHSIGTVAYARTRRRSTCPLGLEGALHNNRSTLACYAAMSSRAPLFLSTVRQIFESATSPSIARPALLTLLRAYPYAEAKRKISHASKGHSGTIEGGIGASRKVSR
jgi:hypothetical protein